MEENLEPVRPGLPDVGALPDSVYFILEDPTPQTRVIYADAIHSDFEKEDIIGCFALDASLNVISGTKKNARYRVSVHTNVETGEDRRFLAPVTDEDDLPRNADCKYLFYYPYDEKVNELSDLQEYSHMILADQNQREKYEASDLLWDICMPDPSLNCVFVRMDHAMSNVIVEVAPTLIKEGTVPTLLSRPKGVQKLNLVRGSLEEMENNLDDESYKLVAENQDIVMWEFGKANSGNYMFRAIVPSNHVITPGTTILSIVNTDGQTKKYRTSMNMSKISFKPGRNYYLNIVEKHDYVAPEIGDDETWVYDVLDPETGQPVGLLCREYLRYQPGRTNFQEDVGAGTPYPSESDVQTKYINSQAWVFYKLRPTGEPDLDEGQVLRFIYDVVYGEQGKSTGFWPEPYEGYALGGVFAPMHGHTWSVNKTAHDYWGAHEGYYGVSSQDSTDYYMHGGTVIWDGLSNRIKSFKLRGDDEKISNKQSYDGHIAIPNQGGDPYLCYQPISSDSPHKVGILSPHYLVDRRVGKQRGVEERLYPLVKIGYNQFWMSRDLRAATQIDGTPLVNYNMEGEPGVALPSDAKTVEPGYLFLSVKNLTNMSGENSLVTPAPEYSDYDPYNQYPTMEERERLLITPMYNFKVLEGSGMLPSSSYSFAEYCIPKGEEIISMLDYLGYCFTSKIITRDLRLRKFTNTKNFPESIYMALLNGKYTTSNMNVFSANICGLDLRPEGYYQGDSFNQPGERSAIMVLGKEGNSNMPAVFSFTYDQVWSPNATTEGMINNTNQFVFFSDTDGRRNRIFAPIRFFLKFNNQADNGGSVSVSSAANVLKGLAGETKAPSEEAFECRDVYIGLEAAAFEAEE